jgi:hypothetical protein
MLEDRRQTTDDRCRMLDVGCWSKAEIPTHRDWILDTGYWKLETI